MGDNDSSNVTWKHALAGFIAAGFMLNGVIKAWSHPKKSAWEEMFNSIKYLGEKFLLFLIFLVLGFVIYFVLKSVLDKFEALYLMWETNRKWRDDRELDLKESNKLKEKIINQNSEIINRLTWVEIDQKSQGEKIKKIEESPQAIQAVNLQQVEDDLLGKNH
jgi:hypothetical protein